MKVNPMYNFVQFMRDIFISAAVPSATCVLLCVFWSIVSIILGVLIFHHNEHKFILYI
jgi:ABC-2 type transport system permease protein